MLEKAEKFKKELKELLDKYDAEISCDFDGDSYGIYNETMSVDFRHKRGFKTDSFKLSDGMNIDENDL